MSQTVIAVTIYVAFFIIPRNIRTYVMGEFPAPRFAELSVSSGKYMYFFAFF